MIMTVAKKLLGSLFPPFLTILISTEFNVVAVGMGLWKPPMDVSMVVVGRGIHVLGYNLLAIKSID